MAFFNLPFGNRIAGPEPVDGDRYVRANSAERDALITEFRAFEGVQCYTQDTKQLFMLLTLGVDIPSSIWLDITDSGGSPGGTTGDVQWNDNGAFAGTPDLFWDSVNGRLGIQTNTPGEILDVIGNIRASAQVKVGTNVLLVNTGVSYLLGGNVGIGEASPPEKLSIKNGNATNNASVSVISLHTDRADAYSTIATRRGGSSVEIGMAFFTTLDAVSLVERMVINPNGNVGIGISPSSILTVQQTLDTNDGGLILVNSADTGTMRQWVDASNHSNINAQEGNLYLRQANAVALTIIPGGNVGIGPIAPTAKLFIKQVVNAANGGIRIDNIAGDGTLQIYGTTGGSAVIESTTGVVNINSQGVGAMLINNTEVQSILLFRGGADIEATGKLRTLGIAGATESTNVVVAMDPSNNLTYTDLTVQDLKEGIEVGEWFNIAPALENGWTSTGAGNTQVAQWRRLTGDRVELRGFITGDASTGLSITGASGSNPPSGVELVKFNLSMYHPGTASFVPAELTINTDGRLILSTSAAAPYGGLTMDGCTYVAATT